MCNQARMATVLPRTPLPWPAAIRPPLYRGARAHEPHASNGATQACTHARTYASNAPLLAGRFPRTTQPDSPLSFPRSVSQARPTRGERKREPSGAHFSARFVVPSCTARNHRTCALFRKPPPLSLSLYLSGGFFLPRLLAFCFSLSLSCFPLALFPFCYRWVVWNSRR